MKYTYFISYSYTKGNMLGIGRANVNRNKKIKSIDDIAEIEEKMKDLYDVNEVTILNWRLYE